MERMFVSWHEAIEIVKQNKSINFFAKVVTVWNALSVDALIASLQAKGIKINAFIVIVEHFANGYLIDETFFTNSCSTYCYMPTFGKRGKTEFEPCALSLISFYQYLFSKRSQANAVYYATFNQATPEVVISLSLEKLLERPVVPCKIEEGVGGYMGTFDNSYPSFSEIKNYGELRSYVRYSLFGSRLYKRLHPAYDSLTLHQGLSGLKINQGILPFYRKTFEIRNAVTCPQIDRKLIANSIVVCTVGWRRNEIVDEEDFRVIKEVCDYLHSLGHTLLLKPHPRDKFYDKHLEELHCSLLAVDGLSMESLCAMSQPKAVISYSSTTLINPKIFWGIPTYCLSDMLQRKKIANGYLDEIDRYKRTFGKFVSFPKKLSDFESLKL